MSDGPSGGFLRFHLPGVGVAGVGASQRMRDAMFPVRRQEGGIHAGVVLRNLSETELALTCRLMKEGAMLEEVEILLARGQEAWYIEEAFTGTDMSDFEGSVRCTAAGDGQFAGMAVELDAGNRIFTTLPVTERMSQEWIGSHGKWIRPAFAPKCRRLVPLPMEFMNKSVCKTIDSVQSQY